MTDKTKAQIEFAKQAVKDALDRTELELFAANEAVHKVVELESKDDPDEFRVMVMGRLVDQLGYMCTPQIKLLGDIAVVLHGFETEEKREGEPVVSRHQPMRRFPPPWTVERIEGGFKVLDANGQSLAALLGKATE